MAVSVASVIQGTKRTQFDDAAIDMPFPRTESGQISATRIHAHGPKDCKEKYLSTTSTFWRSSIVGRTPTITKGHGEDPDQRASEPTFASVTSDEVHFSENVSNETPYNLRMPRIAE